HHSRLHGFGLAEPPSLIEDTSEPFQNGVRTRAAFRECSLPDLERAQVEMLSVGVAAEPAADICQSAKSGHNARMLGAESLLQRCDGTTIESVGTLEVSLRGCVVSHVLENHGRRWMFG